MAIGSVTFQNTALAPVAGSSVMIPASGFRTKTDLYYLLNPPIGRHTLSVTYAGQVNSITAGGVSLENVRQQPPEAVAQNANTGSTTISTEITTQTAGAWIVDVVASGDPGTFTATTGGMTRQWELSAGLGGHTGASSTLGTITPGIKTVSWRHNQDRRLVQSLASFAPRLPLDYRDFALLAGAWLATPADDHWNPQANRNGDLIVDLLDALMLAEGWLN